MSSLALSLWPHRSKNDDRNIGVDIPHAHTATYPWSDINAVAYTPKCRVLYRLRTEEEEEEESDGLRETTPGGIVHLRAEEAFTTAVVSVAALDLRPWESPHRRRHPQKWNEAQAKEKMRSALWVAARHGHTAIVLGALGCGAFKNKPKIVARLFKELLASDEFSGRFQVVVFAIIKSRTNLEAFAQHFPLHEGDLDAASLES
jgi:hypothetical protein